MSKLTKNNNIGILIIIVLIILGLFFLSNQNIKQNILSTIQPPINFAGFTWQTSGDVSQGGEFVFLESTRSNQEGQSISEMFTDISGIDELLVIAEGDGYASSGFGANGYTALVVNLRGSQSGSIGIGDDVGSDSSESSTKTKHFDARVYKIKNNFDGTWSTLESLGIGDIFIIKKTEKIVGNPILAIQAVTSNNGIGSSQSATARVKVKVYNVVVKINAFAVCKADEFWQDKNQDGKPTIDECFDLATIVLNSEEAIKESFDAKLARIELELLAKNQGLTEELEKLKQLQNTTAQQQKLIEIEKELIGTKLLLDELQNRNKELLDLIKNNEQISVINQTIVVVHPINQTLVKETIIIGGGEEKDFDLSKIPLALKIIVGIIGIFILLKLFNFI